MSTLGPEAPDGTLCRSELIRPAGALEISVLMTIIALAAGGVLMGLWFKAPALIAATALLLIGSFAWNGFGFPGHVTVLKFLILAFVLAGAYTVGLFLSVRWTQTGG
ncbi:hypothetical protein X755_16230 [Mesorhizobium sp. LNJC405B00]|nr:hypothetical protein X755_16230 [Mesorhizobium sp. LNJC405B00]